MDGGTLSAEIRLDGPEGISGTVTLERPDGGLLSADYALSVDDVGAFTGALSGPARVTGTATQTQDGWRTEFEATAPAGTSASAIATLGEGGAIALDLQARIERPGEIRDGLPGPIDLTLEARREEGTWTADLEASAPDNTALSLNASLPPEGEAEVAFELRLGQPEQYLNGLPGPVTASGTARREDGRWTAQVRAEAPDGSFLNAQGSIADVGPADVTFSARLDDLGRFVPELAGEATAEGAATRRDGAWEAEFDLDAPQGLSAKVTATLPPEGEARAEFDASIDQIGAFVPQLDGPARAQGTATRQDGDWSVEASLTAPAGIRAEVDALLAAGGDLEADVDASIEDLGTFVPQLAGAAQARAEVTRESGTLRAEATVNAPEGVLVRAQATIPSEGMAQASFEARIRDLGALVPQLEGPARATGTATREDGAWRASADLSAPQGIAATVTATLPEGDAPQIGFDARIDDLGAFVPQLEGPSTATGTVTREGELWRADADLTAPAGIEADIGAALAPDGAIEATYDVRIGALGALVPQLPGAARVQGVATREDGTLRAEAQIEGPEGLSGQVQAVLPPDGPAAIEFDARLANLGAFAEGIDGPLSARGSVLRGEDGRWTVDVTADGPGGSDARVQGSIAADFATADLAATGSLPLALANARLEPRSIEGTARFDLRLDGPLALSSLGGRVTAQDARLSLPRLQQAIEDIDAEIELSGGSARIDLTGAPRAGGRLAVSGPIALEPPFTADLTATLDDVVIRDPLLYETTIDGRLTINGPLTGGGGSIGGTIDVGPTEVRIPSTGFGGAGAIPLIEHANAPLDVRQTLDRARFSETDPINRDGTERRGGGFALDILVRAENRIFVRGRGLDAELGGSLRLTGRTSNIIPVGQFELIRGRLDLLGKRLDLTEGAITLQGDFTPFIRLVATVDDDAGQLSVVVEGELTEPEVTFVSEAGLPQDEAVARLLFGRDIRNLSPLQAARLASAVATLSGRGGEGIIGNLREGFGLDDLDLTTDDEGNVGVRAGKYLSENVYTDLTIDDQGETQLNLNLDLTPDLTVKGRVDDAGETGFGIFFERDY